MYHDAIKAAYPEANEDNYELSDKGDGIVYISKWTLPEPEPDLAVLVSNFDDVSYWRKQKITQAYDEAKALLDSQIVGRSMAEISKWQFLQDEIEKFKSTGNAGKLMDKEVSRGLHTNDSLVQLIDDWVAFEGAVLDTRTAHVIAITSSVDPENYSFS